MNERMLDRTHKPTFEEMVAACGETGPMFLSFNDWLTTNFQTSSEISFPYGNTYGWAIAHRQKKKLICHVFAEQGSFCVMVRLANAQFAQVYPSVSKETQEKIDHKYPCGDGGWLHYRVSNPHNLKDVEALIAAKMSH